MCQLYVYNINEKNRLKAFYKPQVVKINPMLYHFLYKNKNNETISTRTRQIHGSSYSVHFQEQSSSSSYSVCLSLPSFLLLNTTIHFDSKSITTYSKESNRPTHSFHEKVNRPPPSSPVLTMTMLSFIAMQTLQTMIVLVSNSTQIITMAATGQVNCRHQRGD